MKKGVSLGGNTKLNKKQVEYIKANKFSFKDFKKSIPKEIFPTDLFGFLFGFLFLIVIVVGIFNFPLSELLAGDSTVSIDIGYPLAFFKFDLQNAESPPLKIGGLIWDLIIYLIVAYMLNVAANVFLDSSFYKNFKKSKDRAKLYKIKEGVELFPIRNPATEIASSLLEKAREIVKRARVAGYDDIQIRKMFKEKSWPEEYINDILI